jgi:hypothetical protein
MLASASLPATAQSASGEKSAQQIAVDAYIYAYPLVTMEWTRRSFVNVAAASPTKAPMGQFANMESYPAVDDHRVTAPNADTLYSTAWLDVSKEPYVFSIPDMHGRFFLMPMLDGWTTVFQVPGKRTTGTGAQKILITGPGWSGTVPAGLTHYASPTGLVWILGRTYCTGTKADYAAVHALQAQLSLVPLSAYGTKYTPPAGTVNPGYEFKGSVRDNVDAMSANDYFSLFADLMKTNPPVLPQDAAIVAEMAKIGIVPGQSFDASKLDAATRQAIDAAPKSAQAKVAAFAKNGGLTQKNGWLNTSLTGIYGTHYTDRAFVTAIGLGANRKQDAQYPFTQTDSAGQPLIGTNTYRIHFAKGMTPPVNGFWSITMYDPAFFFVPNAIHKQTVSERNDLKYNADGSLDLYFGAKQPAGIAQSNWLPAPSGKFILMMRMYWAKEKPPSILDGSWSPPPVTKAG